MTTGSKEALSNIGSEEALSYILLFHKSFDENFVNIIDSVLVEELRFWGSGARWGDVFPVVHLNIQGLNSSFDDIQLLCRDSCPAIIGLCETFLNENN